MAVRKSFDIASCKPARCASCNGNGGNHLSLGLTRCRACNGSGSILVAVPPRKCAWCNGSGRKMWRMFECPTCKGSGWAHIQTH